MDSEIVEALIISAAPISAVILAAWKAHKDAKAAAKKLEEVHLMVNSRMEQALKDIKDLKDQLIVSKSKEV